MSPPSEPAVAAPSEPAVAAEPKGRLVLGSALAAIACAAFLLATSPGLPMAWDEGNAIFRAEGITQWFGHSRFDSLGIAQDWQYASAQEGHPAFYGIVIALGQAVSGRWLAPLDAARFGPIVLFGLAAGAMCYRLGRQYSAVAAVGAVAALMLLPRLFAHAHFASFDGPLTSCWVLAWAAFVPARRSWAANLLWGVTLGMTLSCKATGWIAPVPFVVWAAAYRDRAASRALAVGLPVALLTFFVLNPPLWHHPLDGWARFFELNLSRAALGLNISTQFLGRMYNLDHPLPWWNTLFWTAVTVPVGLLAIALVGIGSRLRRYREDPAGMLLVANWAVLLIVRAVPGTPPHDGVRLFLPSFAMLAALTGVGCAATLAWAGRRWPQRQIARRLAAAGLVLLYAGAGTSLFFYAPQWLSYYNLCIGGLPGATALGMEPTYYWDALDAPALDWLYENTVQGEKIYLGSGSQENAGLMRRWGTLRRGTQSDTSPGRFRWYVMQHRPSAWMPADHWLLENAQPAYRKTLRPVGPGPWRLDVPLVEIYDYQQYLQAVAATSHQPK